MKKLTTMLTACLLAAFGSVRAADFKNWFDGGIGEDWPTNATMFGGAWCDEATVRAKMTGEVLQVFTDEENPLSFHAEYPKQLGEDATAKGVVINFRCAFQLFSLNALPDVPANAKGAVILVTPAEDPDMAEGGTFYYAAYDAKLGANVWMTSGSNATTNELVGFSMQFSPGEAGFVNVHYNVNGWTASVSVKQTDSISVVRSVAYTGVGRADTLFSQFEPGNSVALNLKEIEGLVVTNVTADGVSIGDSYGVWPVSPGLPVIVYYAAATGYRMEGDGIVRIGVVTQDTTVDENTPGIPEVEALGRYRIGTAVYTSFWAMAAALKDGDEVVMLLDDTLPAEAALAKRITFVVGGHVLSTVFGQDLTIAADVAFTADAAENLPLAFHILGDCALTLPDGTALDDYSLTGTEYARVIIGAEEWVMYNGTWQKSDCVTMNFYYPGYFESVALSMDGFYGGLVGDDELGAFVDLVREKECFQRYYWDFESNTLIEYVYWFDGTWSDERGNPVEVPARYVAGEFYPNSTAVVYRITYDMGGVEDATNPNPTGYSIETRFSLGAASAPSQAFLGWSDADGNPVTEVDPIALGSEFGWLYDITLYANWGPLTSVAMTPSSVTIVPGDKAAYYDTPEAAQVAADVFNDDKEGHICVPVGFTGDKAAYAAHFEAQAGGSAVNVVLTAAAKAELARQVDVATQSAAADLASPDADQVVVDGVEPGFYYSVVGVTMADGVFSTEGGRKLAQEPTVELGKPDLGETDKAFYKIKVSVKP